MKKILIIMIMMYSAIFADDHTFVVENSTMVDVYYNIFNAMASMFKNDEYLDLLRLAFALGGFFVFATAVLNSFESGAKVLSPYAKYILGGFVLLSLVFSAFKSTLWVTAKELPSYCANTSPNVGFAVELPSVLAYSFSTINLIGREMTEMAETAFTKPSATGTTSMADSGGFLGSLKNTIRLQSYNPNAVTLGGTGDSIDFVSLWQKHFNKCVYEVANNKGVEGANKIAELKSSKNLVKWTKDFLDYKFAGSTKATGDSLLDANGVTLSCRNNFQLLVDANTKLADENECYFSDMNGGVLQLITGQNGLAGSNFDEIAIQSGIIYALESSANMASIGVNSGTTYATGKTKAEFIQTSLGQGSYMAEMLPYMQMTMRAILYGFFPFVFVIVLLPGGFKVLVQYGQTMLWIELWGPTAAVINMFLNLQAENELSDVYNEQGITLMSSMDMLSEASTIAGVGAYLYMSVPALTWLILKGSGHMLGSITGGVSAGFAGNLKSQGVAKDMATNSASKASGTSITDTINNIEGSQVANQASDANGFKSIGMNKTVNAKTATNMAQRQAEIEKIVSQGGNDSYIKTQVAKSGYDAVAEKSDVQAKTEAGGKQVVADNQFVKTSTELETTKKEINSAGSKKSVVQNKSDMNNKSFNKDLEVNKNTDIQDYKNLGKQEVAETKSTSLNMDKHGQKKLQDNLTNKKNEETIKESTRYSEIDNKDNFFKKQSQNDFRTKEQVDLLKGDSNGNGEISEKEINRLASINDASSKSQVLAEDVKQKALIQEGKKLNSSNSIEAKEAKNIANNQGGLNKNLAAAVAFNSGAGVKVDTFNKRKDIKAVENFEGAGVQAEDISAQESSSKMQDIAKAKVEAKSLEQDVQGIDAEAKEQITKLSERGLNHIDASKAVLANMAKEGYVSGELTAETLGSEIGEIQKEKEKALSKIGVSAESVEKQEEAVERLNDLANNESFTKEQKQGFKDSANQLSNSISSYKETSQKFDTKMANKVGEYQKAGLVQVDKEGDIKFLDTKKQLESSSQDQKMMILQKIKGSSQGRTTEMNDLDGMESKKVKSLMGSNTTDIKKAVNEWSKTGNYNHDLGYRAVNANMVNRETLANINTGINAVKSTVGAVGVGKFIAGK